MVYIITSKTKSKIRRQPQERAKALYDLREETKEKSGVYSITPTLKGATEEDIHEEIKRQGSGVAEAMEANKELNEKKAKMKREMQKETAEKVRKERIKELEQRDKKNSKLQEGLKKVKK